MCVVIRVFLCVFKHKTAYEMRISDWSSDVGSSDLGFAARKRTRRTAGRYRLRERPLMRTTIFKITLAALVISGLSACGTSTAPSAAGHDTPASIDNEAAECILKSPHLQVGTTPDLVDRKSTRLNSSH